MRPVALPPRVDAVSHDALGGAGRRRPAIGAVLTFFVALLGGWVATRPWTRMGMGMGMGRGRGGMMGDQVAATSTPLLAFGALAICLTFAVAFAPRAPRAAYGAALALTVVYLVAGGPVPAAILAPALTLWTLLRRRPQSEWFGWVALLVPTFAGSALRDPAGTLDDPSGLVLAVFFGVAWVVLPVTIGLLFWSRRVAVADQRAEELRRVAYEERLRVARDIHDVVGHSLSMISLQSGVALHVLDSDPAQVRASLEAIRDSSKSSLADLRQTLGVFRQPDEGQPLVPTPSLAGVPGLVESVRAGGRVVGLVVGPGASEGVPAAVQTVAYRVVQEGLTNVVRHAPGASAAVSIERRPGALAVGVRDDGPLRALPLEGNGLRGMRERVEAVGGRLELSVRPGGGLTVEASLPIAGDVGGGA